MGIGSVELLMIGFEVALQLWNPDPQVARKLQSCEALSLEVHTDRAHHVG